MVALKLNRQNRKHVPFCNRLIKLDVLFIFNCQKQCLQHKTICFILSILITDCLPTGAIFDNVFETILRTDYKTE